MFNSRSNAHVRALLFVREGCQIAQFLGVGEAVLYSFGACTISSVVPSLMNAGDVAVVDEAVGHGVLTGLRLSKVSCADCICDVDFRTTRRTMLF